MNYYEILEVSPKASSLVIRAAYKSLMQRYHPDKNPGDSAVAARAALVVQAYEVLSDSNKRTAYDSAQLQSAKSYDGNNRVANQHVNVGSVRNQRVPNFWRLILKAVLLLFAIWSVISFLKMKQLGDAQLFGLLSEPTDSKIVIAPASVTPEKAGKVVVLVTQLAVELRPSGDASESRKRELLLPVLSVRLGRRDSDHAIRHLENLRVRIRQKLEEDLAEAEFENLIKADGEDYLLSILRRSIGGVFGGDNLATSASDALAASGYGIAEILLPESFSVK